MQQQHFRTARLVDVVLALSVVACAEGVQKPLIERSFPTRDELSNLVRAPIPPRERSLRKGVAVETWELAGPFPAVAGSVPYSGDDALIRAAAEFIDRKKNEVTPTESMQCYAREIGRFLAEHGQLPQDDLQSFAMGRCGLVPNAPTVFYSRSSDAPSLDKAAKFVADATRKISAPSELGGWMGGGPKGQFVVAALGTPQVKLISVDVTRERLRVQGRVLDSTAQVRGYTTAGNLGYSGCVATPESTARLPDFDLSCTLARDDTFAVFDMIAAAPNAIFSRQVLTLVVPVSGDMPASFTSLAVHVVPPSKAGLLEQLNALRVRRSLRALEEVPPQSQTANTVLPHYFAASLDDDAARRELIILGLLAGWDVPGPLSDSQFLSFSGAGEGANTILSELLFFPSNRSVLLDPAARRVALAMTRDQESQVVYGLLATYSAFEGRRYSELETELLDELDRQRQALGKRPVKRAGGPEAMRVIEHIMEKLARGDVSPKQGLDAVTRTLRHRFHRSFQGQLFATRGIDGWRPTYSGPLLELDDVEVTAKVGHFASEGSNWGHYVTYFIFRPTVGHHEPEIANWQVFPW